MVGRVLGGAVVGAAGNLTLEIVTYGDMLLRGRGLSGVPAKMAGILADHLGIEALATQTMGEEADNRRTAVGALLGYGLGVGLGAAYGIVRAAAQGQVATPLAGVGAGLTAMAAADASYAFSGASNPAEWATADWVSDVIPHVVYGLVTVAVDEARACER